MNSEAKKHVLIVTSGGRTGTRFFGEAMGEVVDDCLSFHEPDVLTTDLRSNLRKLRQFGVYQNFVGKLLDRTGLRAVGLKAIAGQLTAEAAAAEICRHRNDFYTRQPASLVVESSLQWFGLLDAVPLAISKVKAICVIRDPRSWVSSSENWGHWWASSQDWVRKLGRLRLTPWLLGDEENCSRWPSMTAFEKLCWSWVTLNRVMFESASRHPNIRMFRFEDLFLGEQREAHLEDMLSFATAFSDRTFRFDLERLLSMSPVNSSGGRSADDWQSWDACRCRTLEHHCGALMREFGYGDEPEWKRKVRPSQ